MIKTRILSYLVKPLNKREEDSAMFVYTKFESVMKSCKTIKQLNNAWHWARQVFDARFPEHKEFWWRLHSIYDAHFDVVMGKMHKEINQEIQQL